MNLKNSDSIPRNAWSPAKHSFGKCDRRTERRTDGRRTKWSLCVAMLRRRHKNRSLRPNHSFSKSAWIYDEWRTWKWIIVPSSNETHKILYCGIIMTDTRHANRFSTLILAIIYANYTYQYLWLSVYGCVGGCARTPTPSFRRPETCPLGTLPWWRSEIKRHGESKSKLATRGQMTLVEGEKEAIYYELWKHYIITLKWCFF